MIRIGVCGLSGSGKTTFSEMLANHLNCPLIAQDSFYIGKEQMLSAGLSANNFDTLAALDCGQLSSILKTTNMSPNAKVNIPIYDFELQEPIGHEIINMKDQVIIEGHLIFTLENILELVDFLIYIDTDRSTAKKRRFTRDISERGYESKSCETYYKKYVIPTLDAIESIKDKADYVVNANQSIDTYLLEIKNFIKFQDTNMGKKNE